MATRTKVSWDMGLGWGGAWDHRGKKTTLGEIGGAGRNHDRNQQGKKSLW